MITNRRPRPILLGSGDVAYFAINKYRCDRGARVAAVRVSVVLPATRGPLALALGLEPPMDYCGPNDPGDLVSISPFELTENGVLHG